MNDRDYLVSLVPIQDENAGKRKKKL